MISIKNPILKNIFEFSLFLLLILSCSKIVKKIDENSSPPIIPATANSRPISIIFSHNISGETHPCGCRNFPLGGLPQVAGLFAKIQNERDLFYVDTGDTFFPSPNIPKTMESSLSFAASNLGLGLEQLGLKLFVPGDQDFAKGLEYLIKISHERKFSFLISNYIGPKELKYETFKVLNVERSKIFFIGLVDPDIFYGENSKYFSPLIPAFEQAINSIKRQGYDQNNPYHRLIVLSHSGIDTDTKLAQTFPFINWIIGAHTQSFLRYSQEEGQVKIVQTLSKNHYIGDIQIIPHQKKETDTYTLHEIRDELEKNLSPNPMRGFIESHKAQLNILQIEEQIKMGMGDSLIKEMHKTNAKKLTTYNTCIECHRPQGKFWQGTPHSLAYLTLIQKNEANSLNCVVCHSLGLGEAKGFTSPQNMLNTHSKNAKNKTRLPRKYWEELNSIATQFKNESIRKSPSELISSASESWLKLDQKFNLSHNFANVQCMNCHEQSENHPNYEAPKIDRLLRMQKIKNKCISCHTADQSPEWYDIGPKLNNTFEEKFKKMSCPIR